MKSKIITSVVLGLCIASNSQAKLQNSVVGIDAVQRAHKYSALRNSSNKMSLAQYLNKINSASIGKFAKTTGLLSRLTDMATTTYDSTHRPIHTDSSHYVYSGSNGGDLTTDWILCDNQTVYTFSSGIYSNSLLITQSIGLGIVNAQNIQSYSAGIWNNYTLNNYGYDPSNNLNSIITQNWNSVSGMYENAEKFEYTYDALNNPIIENDYAWNPVTSNWDNTYRYIYTYAGSSLMTYVISVWNTSTSSWENYSSESMNYDARGAILTDIYQTWSSASSSYQNVNRLVYGYTSGLVSKTANNVWNTTTLSWDNSTQEIYSYDKDNNVIGDITQTWNPNGSGFVNSSEYTSNYNTFGQQTIILSHTWNGSSWTNNKGDVWYNLYYENYGSKTTSVSNVINDEVVNIFPCPASSDLTVNMTATSPSNVVFSIYDLQGRIIKYWSENNISTYSKAISVSGMASGNYILKINAGTGSITKQFAVKH